jgi:hypothetical protein
MSTRNEIIDIIARLSVERSQFIKGSANDIADKWTRVLSDIPFWVLDRAADNWDKENNKWFPLAGQLRAECCAIAGVNPHGGGDFTPIPDSPGIQGPAWQTDELTQELYHLEDMFYHGRIFFPADWAALVANLKAAKRESMVERVEQKRANFEYLIENEHTPTLPGDEAWQLRKDVA